MGDGKEDNPSEEEELEVGIRNERWYGRIDGKVDENAERSRENNRLLLKLDYRTAWIFRVLIAFMAALLLAVYNQAVGL